MDKRVLIVINTAGPAGNGKLNGIFRYLRKRMNWDMRIVRHPAAFTCLTARRLIQEGFDGCILSVGETEEVQRLLRDCDRPAVLLDFSRDRLDGWKRPRTSFVDNSSSAIGDVAADFLLGTGCCRSYAYVHFRLGERPYEWDVQRGRAFAAKIAERGFPCADVLAFEQLLSLERPIGIMAANDETAYNVERFLRRKRVRVPESALVIGVDNDALLCENAVPPLTSVLPDFEREGYLAAQMLDQMMKGITLREETCQAVGVKAIVERQSSRRVTHSGKMIQKALVFIRENALNGIGVNDVARFLGWSRRLADLRFRELQGRTIGETITERRLEEVRRLLTTTNDTIVQIANACNYVSLSHLNALFRRRYGKTLKSYRTSASPRVHL